MGQAHQIYFCNFDVLHSFDIIWNADDVQSWPTSIMWQGKSRYRSSLWKGCWFDRNKSAIDLRIPLNQTVNLDNDVRGRRFEEWTSIWVYHMYCYWRPSYQEDDGCGSSLYIIWIAYYIKWMQNVQNSKHKFSALDPHFV
jgi:hypothetical protein